MIGCYILYSAKLGGYYVGVTQDDLISRITKHNQRSYGQTYTSQTDDWELFLFIECPEYLSAVRIERKIGQMKSRVYIENLKKYPELVEKLKLLA